MNKENARGMQDDTISKRQAIDAVRATLLSWSYMPEWRDNKIIEAVEQLPPIQSEPHWIPISERLPKIYEDVLLSYFDEVTIGWLNGDGSWSIYDGWKCVSADEISAWMPLPKVFKENKRESN